MQYGTQRRVCARSNFLERYGIERYQVTRLRIQRDAFAHFVAPTLGDGEAHAELCRATRCQHGVAVVGYQRVRCKTRAQRLEREFHACHIVVRSVLGKLWIKDRSHACVRAEPDGCAGERLAGALSVQIDRAGGQQGVAVVSHRDHEGFACCSGHHRARGSNGARRSGTRHQGHFDVVQLCLALLRAHNVRGERGEHASRRQKCRYLIDGMVQLAHHKRLREQIACQGAGEDAEVLAHHCYRVTFFVVGLSHLAIGVLYIEHAPAVVAYAKRCRATACGTHGLRCKCRCASRPSNMLQLLVDGCQKARMLWPRHRVGYCGIWWHNAPTRDGLADHGIRCAATTVCSFVCNGHHHFAVDILGYAQLDARWRLRKAEDLTEREAVAQIIRPQGEALQRNLSLAADRLFRGGSAAVEVSARQAPVDQRLAHRDAWTLQTMVAILLKAAARDAAPRRVRHHANSVVAYAQAHNGQYAGCACRIEKGVVAVGALARDQQHVSVLVFSSVRIFHYVEVVIEYAVALHVALAKAKGEVHGHGGRPRAVCLCVHHQA